ncbi:hypothetical protein EYR41_003189 [Orbilia oligospora]|uniref:Plant heme peroxidase family profile domain-containing protein n=1 Tax=Orbilia oligospora TaxID=2813651 RepID=A0A8H2HT21_ORBOL|nr:hypothetical protein EYR41_003189 [Orbilia oligospora]
MSEPASTSKTHAWICGVRDAKERSKVLEPANNTLKIVRITTHVCGRPGCKFDGTNVAALHKHWLESGHIHKILCEGCDSYILFHEFKDHLAKNNGCDTCQTHFESLNQLKMHEVTHKPAIHQCYGKGCSQTFRTLSAMFIHLEHGGCPSTITAKDLNAVLASHSIAYSIGECKDTLGFPHFSALLQHIESSACWAHLGDEPSDILPFLRRNLHFENAVSRIEAIEASVRGEAQLSVFAESPEAEPHLKDVFPQFFEIQKATCQLLDFVQTKRAQNSLGTATLSYKPVITQGIDIRLMSLEVAIAEFLEKYENIYSGYPANSCRIGIWFQGPMKAQLVGLFMREVRTVLRILRLEGGN